MVSWSDETFIVLDVLLSPAECYSSPELSTVQTSALRISVFNLPMITRTCKLAPRQQH